MITLLLVALVASAAASEEEYTTVKIGNQRTLDCKTEDSITWTFSKNVTDEETPVVAGKLEILSKYLIKPDI